VGTGAGNAEKDTSPQAVEWGGAGTRAGGPRCSGPHPPRNKLYHRLVLVPILHPINGGRFHIPSRHIRVGNRINGRDMRIVTIGAVIGQAQVIPSGEK